MPVCTLTLSSQRLPTSGVRNELKNASDFAFALRRRVGDVAAADRDRAALVAGRVRHRRELHDAEREVGRLAALVDGIECTRRVPAAVEERERARIGVEIDVRLGELQRREALPAAGRHPSGVLIHCSVSVTRGSVHGSLPASSLA